MRYWAMVHESVGASRMMLARSSSGDSAVEYAIAASASSSRIAARSAFMMRSALSRRSLRLAGIAESGVLDRIMRSPGRMTGLLRYGIATTPLTPPDPRFVDSRYMSKRQARSLPARTPAGHGEGSRTRGGWRVLGRDGGWIVPTSREQRGLR